MRYLFAVVGALALTSGTVHAKTSLRLSHLQHLYAGGGGCAERFWLDWNGPKEILDIKIRVEVLSKTMEPMAVTLTVDRLGVATSDNATEASAETPSCPDGKARIIVRSATAQINGTPIDLIKNHVLEVGRVERLPLSIANPTFNSTATPNGARQ